jgi:hypothetical protein
MALDLSALDDDDFSGPAAGGKGAPSETAERSSAIIV